MSYIEGLRPAIRLFENEREKFAEEHHDEFVVISSGGKVLGFFNDQLDAYLAGKSAFGKGEFLLHKCVRKEKVVFP